MPIYNSSGNQFVTKIYSNGEERYRVYVVHSDNTNDLVYSKIEITYDYCYDGISNTYNYWYKYDGNSLIELSSRTGYDFGGWYTARDGGGTKIDSVDQLGWENDTWQHTLYAYWIAQTIYVSFGRNTEADVFKQNGEEDSLIIQNLPGRIEASYGQTLREILGNYKGSYSTQNRVNGVTLYTDNGDSYRWQGQITFNCTGWSTKPNGDTNFGFSIDALLEEDITLYPSLQDINIKWSDLDGCWEAKNGGEGSYSGRIYYDDKLVTGWED